jgi:hypothetical protein
MTINQMATITGLSYTKCQNKYTRGSTSVTKKTDPILTLGLAFPHDVEEPGAGGGGVFIVCDDKLKAALITLGGLELVKKAQQHFDFI